MVNDYTVPAVPGDCSEGVKTTPQAFGSDSEDLFGGLRLVHDGENRCGAQPTG